MVAGGIIDDDSSKLKYLDNIPLIFTPQWAVDMMEELLIYRALKNTPMKTPEQRIAELEKKIDEQLVEIVGLKNELKKEPKELTVSEIRQLIYRSTHVECAPKHISKLQALYDMVLVADYLNDGWKPDWEDDSTEKYAICYDFDMKRVDIMSDVDIPNAVCYFKSEALAKRAIKILGEERIKLALS